MKKKNVQVYQINSAVHMHVYMNRAHATEVPPTAQPFFSHMWPYLQGYCITMYFKYLKAMQQYRYS